MKLSIAVIGILVIIGGIFIVSSSNVDAPSEIDKATETQSEMSHESSEPNGVDEVQESSTQEKSMTALSITSSAFEHEGLIPSEFTCDGSDSSPELTITGVPEKAQSLALIMDDPDAPNGTWDHWVIYNMLPEDTVIPEGAEPMGSPGLNSWQRGGYGGPCPPDGEHRYFFKVYALSAALNFFTPPTKDNLIAAMQDNIIAEAELMGRYGRQ